MSLFADPEPVEKPNVAVFNTIVLAYSNNNVARKHSAKVRCVHLLRLPVCHYFYNVT